MLETITSIITAFESACALTVIRSEQKGDSPAYPYCAYKLTDMIREKAHLAVIETKPKDGDTAKSIVTYKGQSDIIISLSFLHGDARKLWPIVWKACDWWDDYAPEICAELGLVVTRLSDPTDRTVSLETDWEYKFGFDMKLSGSSTRTREVDTVDIDSIIKSLMEA